MKIEMGDHSEDHKMELSEHLFDLPHTGDLQPVLKRATQEQELKAAGHLAQCQADLNTTAVLLNAASVQLKATQEEMCRLCPLASSCYETHCYYFSAGREEARTWNESIQFCRQWEASLAVIEDLREMEFIQAEMGMFLLPQFFWVGLTDSIQEDQWVWQDGRLHRDLDLPSVQWNIDHRDCADVRGDRNLFAVDCEEAGAWLCEKPLVGLPLALAAPTFSPES